MGYDGKFTFLEQFYRQAQLMDDEQELRYYRAICAFAFDGEVPDFSDDPIVGMAWVGTEAYIARGLEMRRRGARGGIAKGLNSTAKKQEGDLVDSTAKNQINEKKRKEVKERKRKEALDSMYSQAVEFPKAKEAL